MPTFYVYIIRCQDDYLYVGITNNLDKRLAEHRLGFCRNTKNRGTIEIVFKENYTTRIDAAKREKEIKGWRREKKEKLISSLH